MSEEDFKLVREVAGLRAGPIKIAAFEVWDHDKEKYHDPQIHMTVNGTVYAVLGVESAKLLSKFVDMHFNQED